MGSDDCVGRAVTTDLEGYRARLVEPGLWQLSDVLGDRAYLAVGRDAALLVDATAGIGNLACAVRRITTLPLTVVATHSHYDHIGGAWWFEDLLISAADDGRWEAEREHGMRAWETMVAQGLVSEDAPFGLRDGAMPRVRHVFEGDVFDLGGMTVEAIALPGHTPGSTGYLLRERRVLLSGDAVTPIMCLFFAESLDIPQYRLTLQKMAGLPFDRFYTGHHDLPFGREVLPGFDDCARFALTDRGMTWQHSVLPEFMGTIHLAPCETDDVDSPDFRALIGPYVPRKRGRRARRR